MTKVIAIANQNRGGAEAHPVGDEARRKPSEQQAMRAEAKQCADCELQGKTSTTVNLGAGLVRQGYAVLAIDFDPQANLTMALGFKSPEAAKAHDYREMYRLLTAQYAANDEEVPFFIRAVGGLHVKGVWQMFAEITADKLDYIIQLDFEDDLEDDGLLEEDDALGLTE